MRFYLFLLLPAAWAVSGCQSETNTASPKAIYGKDWYYTHHKPESKEGYFTYKPQGTFEMVAGMGIDGFRFNPGGGFVFHTQGPADEVLDVPGTWQAEATGTYRITLKNGEPPYRLTIEVLDDNTLRAHKE